MKGLVIWAQSNCRSMMGVYAALKKSTEYPVVIALWHYPKEGCQNLRDKVGFKSDEFGEVEMIPVGESWEAGKKILDDHLGFSHLFAVYQGSSNFRRLITEAKKRGEKVGIVSEAPCNMTPGWKGWLKEHVYLPFVLPWKIRKVVKAAEFILNLSGDDTKPMERIGWPKKKIIPFGYYSPPIPGSKCVARTTNKDFHILVTGIMTWHRAPDVVLEALSILKAKGVSFKATFTQKGPLLESLKARAAAEGLDVDFPGFLPMEDLIRLYETCSVYVAAGRAEPWGMRLNDAVQCGAPIAVSSGMGGRKMVDEYGCGFVFERDNAEDLARQLKRMIEDETYYRNCASKATEAARQISPEVKAVNLKDLLEKTLQESKV